jgi:hypothetical protein
MKQQQQTKQQQGMVMQKWKTAVARTMRQQTAQTKRQQRQEREQQQVVL